MCLSEAGIRSRINGYFEDKCKLSCPRWRPADPTKSWHLSSQLSCVSTINTYDFYYEPKESGNSSLTMHTKLLAFTILSLALAFGGAYPSEQETDTLRTLHKRYTQSLHSIWSLTANSRFVFYFIYPENASSVASGDEPISNDSDVQRAGACAWPGAIGSSYCYLFCRRLGNMGGYCGVNNSQRTCICYS